MLKHRLGRYQSMAVFLLCLCCAFVNAQQVNTLYFLEDAPTRHDINPAFQPTSNGYLLLPVIGWYSFGVTNNSISVNDIFYPNTLGQTTIFLHPKATANGPGTEKFYNTLNNTIKLNVDADINLLSFGFRVKKHYFHVTMSERLDAMFGIKKDVLGIILRDAMNDKSIEKKTNYDLSHSYIDASLYTEFGVGYSYELNEQWRFGAKLKYLYGSAHTSLSVPDLKIDFSDEKWIANGDVKFVMAGPFGGVNTDGVIYEDVPVVLTDNVKRFNLQPFNRGYFRPKGHGLAFDLGFAYKPFKQMTISLALTDLGFIHWHKGYSYQSDINTIYTGAKYINYEDFIEDNGDGTISFNTVRLNDTINSRINDFFDDAFSFENPVRGYNKLITAKLNIGVDANFFNNQFGFGLYAQTKFYSSIAYEEITFGVAYRPRSWFNIAASYSFFNGRWSNLGIGLLLRGGPIGLTLTTDYIPLAYTGKAQFGNGVSFRLPKTKGLNFGIGLSLQFGYRNDKDKDGVKNQCDLCPDTPKKVKVDKNGCPVDSDGDNVPDYLDRCPQTPTGVIVNEDECPVESEENGK